MLEEIAALLQQQSDDTLAALATLIPVISQLRAGGLTAIKAFGMFHDAGLPSTLVVQSQPGRRERERAEASVISGRTAQLALDFSIERVS